MDLPKKAKAFKANDRVICVSEKRKLMYLVRGTVRYSGPVQNPKGNFVGVEFDKLVKSTDDVKVYFKCKPGFGAFLEAGELYLVTNDKFDEAAFRKALEGKGAEADGGADAPSMRNALSSKNLDALTPKGGESPPKLFANNVTKSSKDLNDLPVKPVEPAKPPEPAQTPPPPAKPADIPKEPKEPAKPLTPPPTRPTPAEKPEPHARQAKTPEPARPAPKDPLKTSNLPAESAQDRPKDAAPERRPRDASPAPLQMNVAVGASNFVEIQKLNLQISNLQTEKVDLQIQVEKLDAALTKVTNKYQGLKALQEASSQENVRKAENTAELQSKIVEQEKAIKKMSEAAEKAKELDLLRPKFEKALVEVTSMKEELATTQKERHDLAKELGEAREQLEIRELEAEIEARADDAPKTLEEFRTRYLLVKQAFRKLDAESFAVRDGYDKKVEQLNSQIVKLKSAQANALASDEVQKVVAEKNKEIQDLQELVNDFQRSRVATEGLFDEYQAKKDELERVSQNLGKSVELVKHMQEQIQELEGIIKESDDCIGLLELRVCQRDDQIKALAEDNDSLKKAIEKYKGLYAELQENFARAELQQNAQGGAQAASATDYYQNYTEIIRQKQDLLKEKMNFKLRAKQRNMEAVKLLVYTDAVPPSLQALLKREQFDSYAEVCLTSEQIDIVAENLILHFVLNEQLNIDNPALVSFSKDLVRALERFQFYLNLLRGRLTRCSRQSEYEQLVKTDFFQKLYHSFPKIRDIYELVKSNELSTQFSFSEITESALQLKQDLSEDMALTPEGHIKSVLSSMVSLLFDKFFDSSVAAKDRNAIQAVCKKLVHLQEKIFDSVVTDKDLETAKHLASACPENVAEIRHWADGFSKALDEAEMNLRQAKDKIADAYWKETIGAVRTELDKHEALTGDLEEARRRIRELEEEDDKKSKAIAALNKEKITLDSKVVKLKIISNNFSALEMELADLRRSEKNSLQTIEDLTSKLKAAEAEAEERKKAGDKFGVRRNAPSIVEPSRQLKTSVLRAGMSFAPVDGIGDITGRNSIEINSLSSILANSLAKLNEVRSQNASQRLNKLLQKSDAFSAAYQAHFQPNKAVGTVAEILDNIRNNQADIKREVARLNVISLAEPVQTSQSITDFNQKQNNIANLLSKNKQWLEEFVKVTQARELGYHPDVKKEVLGAAEQPHAGVYGKLTVAKDVSIQPAAPNAKVVNVDLSVLLK